MIFRQEDAKGDLVASWTRPDRPFFAAGACHILAAAFLETYPDIGFYPLLILPDVGFRGTHLVVSNGRIVFDYHGYTQHNVYFAHYFNKIRRYFPQWRGELIRLKDSPISTSFCQKYEHRLPDQYLYDPRPRARSYLNRFQYPDHWQLILRQAQDDRISLRSFAAS